MREKLAQLSPAYFALVMATGSVGLAAHLLRLPSIAIALFWINAAAFAILAALTAARIICCAAAVGNDLVSHEKAIGFFTAPAACCVLGIQSAMLFHDQLTATALWVVAIGLWVPLTYAIFTAFIVKRDKPPLDEGINGGWLIAVVAIQAIATLGAHLAGGWADYGRPAVFFSLIMWLGGGMLYFWIIPVLFYRYVFFRVRPSDLQPVFWVNMGAMSISALAGSSLISQVTGAEFVQDALPVLRGSVLLYWAAATWWIPMLLVLGVWRHVYERFPLTYSPLYWGMVFPLGMYTVATHEVAQTLDAEWLRPVPKILFVIALLTWGVVFAGMAISLVRQAMEGMRNVRRHSGASHSRPGRS